MQDADASQSTGPPRITESALRRRVFDVRVNTRLRQTTLLRVLPSYLKGKVAVDVGAATGHITYFLKDFYKEVWAFEPVIPVYSQLVKMEGFPGIHTVNAAVSNFNGEDKIYVDHKRLSNSGFQDLVGGPQQDVRVVSLDSYLRGINDIGFIKIDVEGTEFDVLKGAQRIIDGSHPTLMVEIYQPYSKEPLDTIFKWLMGKGYKCGFYSHPNLIEVASPDEGKQAVKDRHAEHDGDFLFYR